MSNETNFLEVTIGHSHPKRGFLKAVSVQHEIAFKLCRRYKKGVSYFDAEAQTARGQFKRLSKVQEFWMDKALEEVMKLRLELSVVKAELQVYTIYFRYFTFFQHEKEYMEYENIKPFCNVTLHTCLILYLAVHTF